MALAIIVLAGALSAVWAFVVPIFQAPDEPAHFDYAISIYNARGLIRLADGRLDWIVSPYTKYLLRATDFQRIAWHSSMRAPRGYGSRPYYARIDARAPSLEKPASPNGRINYIVPDYPFGFYALEALWMHAVALVTGSLVTVFFAARLLCVFLTMTGLYFNYRTALNLGLPRWTSVALIAAIGFFPLTSFVSSYVQPDNLTYALISVAFFFASSLPTDQPRPERILALGLTLGLLAVTKYQFFVTAAIPILLLVAARLAHARATGAVRAAAVAALLLPAIILLSVQHWIVGHADAGGRSSPFAAASLFEPFRSAIAQGTPTTLYYLASNAVGALTDFFVSGVCAATYWQVVGWFDTPIVIFNDPVEAAIRDTVSVATLAVVVVLVLTLSRNALRLLSAAARGHSRRVLAIAVADPVLNSYILFSAVLISLYVVTSNGFVAEGRQWYPYVFPAFLSLVWYAPRALTKRHCTLSAALTGTLLCYCVVAAGFALADVIGRYYAPQTARYVANPQPATLSPGEASGVLRPLERSQYINAPGVAFSFIRGTPLVTSGGVVPNGSSQFRIAVILDRRTAMPVLSGQYNLRIAEAFHNTAAGYGGFYANVATSGLAEGPHIVEAFANSLDDSSYQRVAPTRLFFVTTRNDGFSDAFLGEVKRTPAVSGRLKTVGTCRGASALSEGRPGVSAGAVLLVAGRVDAPSTARRYDAAWLLAGRHPYPARYDIKNGSFVGTIPTADLTPGVYRLLAYAVRVGGIGNDRISNALSFRVTAGPGGNEFPAHPSPLCNDPLRQLSGS